MRYTALVLALSATLLSACSKQPDPIVVPAGVPVGQAAPVMPQAPMQQQDSGQYAQQPAPVVQYTPAPQVQYVPMSQAQAPMIVQQHDSGMSNLITGMAVGAIAGHALSNANSGPAYREPARPYYGQGPVAQPTTVIKRTTIINQAAPAAPAAAPVAAAPVGKSVSVQRPVAAAPVAAPAVQRPAPAAAPRSVSVSRSR